MTCFDVGGGRWVLLRNHELGNGAWLEKYGYVGQEKIVAWTAADLPVDPGALGPLVAAVGDADVVVGSRRLPGSSFTSPQPWARRFGGGVFLQLVRLMGLLQAPSRC